MFSQRPEAQFLCTPSDSTLDMTETFRDVLCAALPLFVTLFGVSTVLLVLLAFTIPFVESGSRTFVTSILGGTILSVVLVGSAVVIRVCRRS